MGARFMASSPYERVRQYLLRGILYNRQQPYYLEEPELQMLPQMHVAVHHPSAKGNSLWDPKIAACSLSELRSSITTLLDRIGEALYPEALHGNGSGGAQASRVTLPGSEGFARPLLMRSFEGGRYGMHDQCMLIDPARVRNMSHMSLAPQRRAKDSVWGKRRLAQGPGYLKLVISSIRNSSSVDSVTEYAHRVVLWSMYGPPPADIRDPVAMHTCNHPGCLSPNHLVYGERSENVNVKLASEAARSREADQRGFSAHA